MAQAPTLPTPCDRGCSLLIGACVAAHPGMNLAVPQARCSRGKRSARRAAQHCVCGPRTQSVEPAAGCLRALGGVPSPRFSECVSADPVAIGREAPHGVAGRAKQSVLPSAHADARGSVTSSFRMHTARAELWPAPAWPLGPDPPDPECEGRACTQWPSRAQDATPARLAQLHRTRSVRLGTQVPAVLAIPSGDESGPTALTACPDGLSTPSFHASQVKRCSEVWASLAEPGDQVPRVVHPHDSRHDNKPQASEYSTASMIDPLEMP